jgi:hypothetical protein
MKMSISVEGNTAATATIEHNGETLVFDITSFNKNALGRNAICEHINAYWEFLPMFKQEKIFELYSKIRNSFEDHYTASPLIVALMPLTKQLYDLHEIEDIRRWMSFHTAIRVPADVEDSYVHSDDRPFSRERTYTKPDYYNLLALVLSMRIMIPIWGEFIYRTGADTDTSFKEYYAFGLISQAKINDSSAMVKLREYIGGNLQPDLALASIIVGGVGTENHELWALATLCVKRLCIGDLKGIDANANLVVTIYNDLIAKNTGSGTHIFGKPIHNKLFDADNGDEHGSSRMENFKIKAEHSIGDIAVIEHHARGYRQVALQLDPNMDLDLLEKFYASALSIQKELILQAQTSITQWIVAPVIPPRGIYYLKKMTMIKVMSIAQTWAWQHGHKKIAGLLTAIASDASSTIQHSGIGSMARIAKEQSEQLAVLFPFNKVSAKRRNTVPPNSAVVAIDNVAENLSARDWILTLPDEFAIELVGSQHHRRYGCPHDIKIALAKLAIECASRPKSGTKGARENNQLLKEI